MLNLGDPTVTGNIVHYTVKLNNIKKYLSPLENKIPSFSEKKRVAKSMLGAKGIICPHQLALCPVNKDI